MGSSSRSPTKIHPRNPSAFLRWRSKQASCKSSLRRRPAMQVINAPLFLRTGNSWLLFATSGAAPGAALRFPSRLQRAAPRGSSFVYSPRGGGWGGVGRAVNSFSPPAGHVPPLLGGVGERSPPLAEHLN